MTSLVSFTLALLAALLPAAHAAVADSLGLGPGRGAWRTGVPEEHGLSTAELAAAAAAVQARAAERYCLVVVKDGVIVHESYFANTSESIYESDSLAKTFTAALVGVAVQQGLVDIDQPLADMPGMKPHANWSANGVDYFPRATARNLLSQSSGYGVVPPGERLTYSSDFFTQELSHLLTAATRAKTNRSGGAIQWASDNFATPLGLPELYAYDGLGEEISATGGQMMSCRDAARVGQLVVNEGVWLDNDGKPYQMADRGYMRQVLEPAVPGKIDGYGGSSSPGFVIAVAAELYCVAWCVAQAS